MRKIISGTILPLAVAALMCTTTAEAATGKLNLTVNGVPSNGVVFARNAQGTLKRLVEGVNTLNTGTYRILVVKIRRPGATVDGIVSGTASPALVNILANQTKTSVATYRVNRAAARLWVPATGEGQAQGFARTQLATDFSGPGSVVITGIGSPFNTAFDRTGNLWVASCTDNRLLKYSTNPLATGSAPASVTITANANGSLDCPVGIAFDKVGNMWVSNYDGDTLVKYTIAQRLTSGAPTPAVTISSNAQNSLDKPYGLAFNAKGHLWVANNGGNNAVGYTPAQLNANGSPAPTFKTGAIETARSPAFDKDGKMWIASRATGRVLVFTLGPAGTPTLAATVNLENGGNTPVPVSPTGLAFDNEGDLWVAAVNHVFEYAKAGLVNGATVQPKTDIDDFGTGTSGVLISFYPAPRGLPLPQ
jgi:sugar lactone lactonase YvrE